MDEATLSEANLSSLSSSDIQQLAELSQELHLTTQEMETEGKTFYFIYKT